MVRQIHWRAVRALGLAALAAAVALGATRPAQQGVSLRPLDAPGASASPRYAVAREPADEPVVLSLDDGSYEGTIGIVTQDRRTGSQGFFLNRFTPDPTGLPFTIDAVSILFPVHGAQGGLTGLVAGLAFDVLVFVDPTGSGSPADTTLEARKPFVLQPSDTVFQDIQLDLPIVIQSGDVWIGFTNTVTRTDRRPIFPAALDTSSQDQGRSFAFFNDDPANPFDGPLDTADQAVPAMGNWLIRARGQVGGLTCVTWSAPGSLRGDDNPPPFDMHVCDDVPEPVPDGFERPRETLMGYKVYRSNEPGVQPTPENFFTSTPPTQTAVGSSVGPGGSFFVVTAVYDTGESGPSNQCQVVPPTVTRVRLKGTTMKVKGSGFTDTVQCFVDGIPFAAPAVVKKAGTRVVQPGTLVTGQTIDAYLAEHNNRARVDMRNSTGAIRVVEIGP